MHLAFRVQSEEFFVVTRIKLRDVLHPFLFRIPNFGGALSFFLQDKVRIETNPLLSEWKMVGVRKRGFSFREILCAIKEKIRLYFIHKKIFIAPTGEEDEIFW